MFDVRSISTLKFQLYACALLWCAQVAIIWVSLGRTDGHLVYTLDDPYIHLAVAENLLRGGYGVNIEEFSSPSSSIAYPWLLALPVFLGVGDLAPLAIGVVAMTLSMWWIAGLIWRSAGASFGRLAAAAFVLIPPVLMLALNALALPMTGMEHALHVLGVTMVFVGLLAAVRQEPLAWVTLPGVLICGLIRFEGLPMALATLTALFLLGRRKAALATAALLASGLLGYAALMVTHGLPMLPSSVLSKAASATFLNDHRLLAFAKSLAWNVWASLDHRGGLFLAFACLFVGIEACRRASLGLEHRVVYGVAAVAMVSHLMAGHFGGFARYEVYIVTVALIAFFAYPRDFGFSGGSSAALLAVLGVLGLAGVPYLAATGNTPPAAQNIYQQQYQMHRFATEYFPHRVAVNDLGLVAYRNDRYVLDLVGLGSEEARRLIQQEGRTANVLRRLTAHKGITYAMVYEGWFSQVPAGWRRVATLKTSQVTAAQDTVTFYLIDAARRDAMLKALRAFSATLPHGAALTISEDAGGRGFGPARGAL